MNPLTQIDHIIPFQDFSLDYLKSSTGELPLYVVFLGSLNANKDVYQLEHAIRFAFLEPEKVDYIFVLTEFVDVGAETPYTLSETELCIALDHGTEDLTYLILDTGSAAYTKH